MEALLTQFAAERFPSELSRTNYSFIFICGLLFHGRFLFSYRSELKAWDVTINYILMWQKNPHKFTHWKSLTAHFIGSEIFLGNIYTSATETASHFHSAVSLAISYTSSNHRLIKYLCTIHVRDTCRNEDFYVKNRGFFHSYFVVSIYWHVRLLAMKNHRWILSNNT